MQEFWIEVCQQQAATNIVADFGSSTDETTNEHTPWKSFYFFFGEDDSHIASQKSHKTRRLSS
jgi:hypothetical protein